MGLCCNRPVDVDGFDAVLTSPPYASSGFRRAQEYRHAAARAVRELLGDNLIVLDTEPQGPRLYEVGMVRLTFGYAEAFESFLIDPGRDALPFPAATASKTETAALVAGVGTFSERVQVVHNFVGGHRRFLGWNPANDRDNFLGEFRRAGLAHGETTWVDGRRLYGAVSGRGQAPRLEKAYEECFGLTWKQRHYALDDALRTVHLLSATALRMLAAGMGPEDVVTEKGALGTAWGSPAAAEEPRRRLPLPPPPLMPAQTLRRVQRWREAEGFAWDREPCPLPFSERRSDLVSRV